MSRLTTVRAVPPSTLSLTFSSGRKVEIDIAALFELKAFGPLADPGYFVKAELDDVGGIVWPNGADISPEYLEQAAREKGLSLR
jgi:hypothetical protein